MESRSLNRCKSGVASEACSIEFLCRIPSIAKDLTQLKKTGENFALWERELKVMIHNLSGASDYLQHGFDKYDPKLNRAVFNLIFWSIEKELQHDLDIDGSAGDAFQALKSRFQSTSSPQFIMNRADLPPEILDKMVNIIYLYSSSEASAMRTSKQEGTQSCDLPLTTFQSLAVANRKFYRLCCPKLWQKLFFPAALSAPMSIWTAGILLNHGNRVKSFRFELEDLSRLRDGMLSPIERSSDDNRTREDTSDLDWAEVYLHGIGPVNIEKIFKACPRLESVEIYIPLDSYVSDLSSRMTSHFKGLFGLVPQLQHLKLVDGRRRSPSSDFVIDLLKHLPSLVSLDLHNFKFVQKSSTEESFGWGLAQHRTLRNLRLECVTCQDQTWALNSWPQRLATLEIYCCPGLTSRMAHKLLSASAPLLTRLKLTLEYRRDEPNVNDTTDLLALKQLILACYFGFGLLTSFKRCKDLEFIKYSGPMTDDQWGSLKDLLSTYTWPKLSVLKLHNPKMNSKEPDRKIFTEEDVDAIWNSYKIRLLIF